MNTKIYVAVMEDSEGCGTIATSIHASLQGATDALRKMVASEFRMAAEGLADLDADEIEELINDEEGKTAKVELHEVKS